MLLYIQTLFRARLVIQNYFDPLQSNKKKLYQLIIVKNKTKRIKKILHCCLKKFDVIAGVQTSSNIWETFIITTLNHW